MKAPACIAPTAAAGAGRGPGLAAGRGPRGAGRAGARAPEFAGKPGASRENGPKFRLPRQDAKVELKVRSLGEEAVVGWRGCVRPELLRTVKQDEAGWVLVHAGSMVGCRLGGVAPLAGN